MSDSAVECMYIPEHGHSVSFDIFYGVHIKQNFLL